MGRYPVHFPIFLDPAIPGVRAMMGLDVIESVMLLTFCIDVTLVDEDTKTRQSLNLKD